MSRAKTKSVAALLAFAAAFLLAALFCFGFPARRAHAEDATASDALGLMNAVQNVAESRSVILAAGKLSVKDTEFVLSNATSPSVGSEGGESGSIEMDLQSQINLAGNGATVSLDKDYTESVVIPEGKTITLDLNGHTLTSDTDNVATVYNDGNLTIVDNGTTKGKITREAAEADGSENTYYVIANHGVMTLDGIHVSNENVEDTSSLIINNIKANGVYEQENPAKLTIESGTYFCAGGNVVKNDEYGILVIEDGEFTCSEPSGKGAIYAVIQNWANATITGGIFTHTDTAEGIAYSACAYDGQTSSNNISGGTFSGATAIYLKPGDDTAGIVQMTVSGTAKIQGVIAEDVTFPMEADDSCAISGGSFTVEPDEKYLADNFEFIDNDGDGVYEVKEGIVAKIGDVGYTDLAAAFAEADDGDTITLVADMGSEQEAATETSSIEFDRAEVSVTFDLNGHSLYLTNGTVHVNNGLRFMVVRAGTIIVTNSQQNGGVISASGIPFRIEPEQKIEAKLVLEKGVKVIGQGGPAVFMLPSGEAIVSDGSAYYAVLETSADLDTPTTFAAIQGNGTSHGTSITVNGGKLTSNFSAIYQPQFGKLVINDGVLEGQVSGMEIRGGSLEINDGEIIAHGEFQRIQNGSGSTLYGVAVAVSEHSTEMPIVVTINDGTFTATDPTGYAYYQADTEPDKIADVKAVLKNGTFNGAVASETVSNFIENGTFSKPLERKYLAPDCAQMESDDGFIVGSAEELDGAVAMIEETGVAYTSLQDAIDAAETDVTITLLADIGTNEAREGLIFKMEKAGVSVTLDLADHSIYSSVDGAIQLIDGTLTVKNGYILAMGDVFRIVPDQQEKVAKLVLEDSLTAKSEKYCAVFIEPTNKTDKDVFNAILVTSANLSTDGAFGAIQGNGSADGVNNRFGTSVTITGGRIESKDLAIYQPQYGELIITGGEIIGGTSAIEIRAGILKISGDATIVANGKELSCVSNGNGSTTNGVAVAVIQHTTGLALNASITGGTLKGLAALYQANPEQNDASEIENVSLEVENGTFNGQVYSENKSGFISGGFFDKLPESALFAEGFTPVDNDGNGVYEVMEGVVAKIGDVGYTSLQEAINAAETGETVTLLSNVSENITVAQDKQITLDLNGNKIENDGSRHTVTNYGTLTVTGNGTVDNTANGRSALYNAPDASLTILSGTFVRSQEAGSLDGKSDGGNSYYVILNQGEMVIGTADDEAANEEILVYAGTSPEDSANHRRSSLISSGYFDTATYQEENAYPTLTIYGGTFYGGNGTVKNDELNTLTIAGGTFHAPDQALMNWSKATITGGEFNGSVIAWYYNGVNLGKYDVSTDIQGGVFNNVVEDRNFSNGNAPRLEGIMITSGTFASPVREDYLAEGYSFTLEGGNYVPANTAAVAEIDREGVVYPFAELAAALEAAQSGDTIRLLADYTGSISLAKEGVTLDLNGNDIITTGSVSLSITAGNVTVTNSAEEESVIRNSAYIAVYVDNTDAPVTITNIRIDLSSSADSINTVIGIYADNAEIAVDSVNIQVQASGDVTIEPTNQNMWAAAIVVSNSEAVIENSYLETEISGNRREGHTFHSIGNSDTVLNNVEIVSNDSGAMIVGTYGNTDEQKEAAVQADQNTFPKLTITNSKITATGFAVLGNGAAHGTVIDISDSMITSETAQTIYHPQYGYMYISGDTEITGYTGIEMRAGNLVFNGGTVTATGDFSEEPYGNGSTVGGAALAISQHTTNMPISVTVNGGTFNATGNGGYAVYEVDLQNEEATDVIEIALNGGTYNAAVDSENVEQYIHGGQYIELPADEAFADNYEGVEYNGYYVVIESTTDDTAALLAARANAQADVKAYAASLGVKWQEIVNAAADAESENYEEAVLVVNMYDAIGSALSESAVAVARLNAMDAIEGYVSSAETALQTAKTDALNEIAEAAKATETQAEVVVPTATLLAINSAATVEEVNSYKENALKEIADIRAYRADIADQTAMLQALKDVIAGVDGEENSSLLDEIDALISQAQTAIVGTDDSVSLGSIYKDLGGKIDEVQSTLDTAVQEIKAELGTIDGFADELESLLKDETNGLSAIRQIVADAKNAIDSAAAGTNLSALSQAITDAQNAITRAIGEVETELVSYNALLTGYNTQLQALSGKLGETAGASIAADIAALKQTIDSVNSSLGSLATGTDTDEIAAAIAGIKTTIDGIAAEVGQAAAVEEAKTNAVAEIASWLEGYLDEIIGGSASQNIVASMAVTLETEEGDLYAKIVSAFGEKNAPLVLKYYNEALTAIDNAESVSDVTMAVSTFKAQVASVEAAAGNTPALTGVYVLLAVVLVVLIAAAAAIIVLTLKKKPAAEAAAPVQEAPAQEAPAESAQEDTPAAETAEEDAAQEETPAAEAQPAEALEEASDELAAADDDKDRIVIEANVRTFNEAYEELDEDKKALFNDVKEYALTKPQTRQVDLSSGICVKYGSKQVVKLVVRRGYPVALFLLENEMLKDFRRTTNSSAKLKIHATELVLREEADLAAAHRMVDLSLEQIAIDIENAKERRREARRARRKQKQAEAQADGESSDS